MSLMQYTHNHQPPMIKASNLWFSYPGDPEPVLRDISFAVAPGEAVALVGGCGAGKSTLLLHLNGTLTAERGHLQVAGQPVDRQNAAAARQAVGLVFQDPDDQLFMPTVWEDVIFGPLNQNLPRHEAEQRAMQALLQVGMAHLRERPPYKLSGGEKRAVAIATVLAMEPDILVLDEPSANLDPQARRRLIALLRGFHHTRVVATHDLELVVELCSRVLLLDGGQLIAAGPTRDLLANETLMLAHGLEKPHSLRHPHPHNQENQP